MKFFLQCCLSILFLSACKNHVPNKIVQTADAQSSPNSCKIEATIVKALDPSSPDRNDICHRYSCEAIVHVDKLVWCGQSVTLTADDQSQITLHFAYTLNPTEKLFPTMKTSYPGLKKGSHFTAVVEQHIAPGDQTNFIVYDYQVR